MNWRLKSGGKKVLCAITALAIMLIILISAKPVAAHATDNTLEFAVKQVFTTSSAAAKDVFTYILKPLEAGSPLPAGSAAQGYTFAVSGTGSVKISLPNNSGLGHYRYELYQVDVAQAPGYTYDKRVFTIEAHMGAEKITVLNQDGAKVEDIKFENSYDPLPSDPRLMVDPPVKKNVFGNPSKDSVFIFKLTAREASQPMPPGSVDGVKTLTVVGSGEGEFGVWSYYKAGVYFYTVSEVHAAEYGYVYDTTVYTITDTVTEVDGQLVLNRVVTNSNNKPVTTLTFINRYDPGGGNSGGNGGGNGGGYGGGNPGLDIGDGGTPVSGISAADFPVVDMGGGDPGNNPGAVISVGNLPKTGDANNPALYILLLALGALLVIGASMYLTVGKRKDIGCLI